MKSYFILLLLITTCCPIAFSQDTLELNNRNGFKQLKLGTSIDSVKGAILKKAFKEKDEFDAKLFDVKDKDLENVGDVPVKDVRVMTYDNLIYKIIVVCDKDPRVMRALEKAYGKSKYILRSTNYTWGSSVISLTFHANRNSIDLTYRSLVVIRKMYHDKQKKADAIAEDF